MYKGLGLGGQRDHWIRYMQRLVASGFIKYPLCRSMEMPVGYLSEGLINPLDTWHSYQRYVVSHC